MLTAATCTLKKQVWQSFDLYLLDSQIAFIQHTWNVDQLMLLQDKHIKKNISYLCQFLCLHFKLHIINFELNVIIDNK